MSDQRIRAKERTWRETGTVEDKTSWLLERVRSGHLGHTAVKTCALLGDDACVHVLSEEGIGVVDTEADNYPRLFMALACMDYEQHKRAVTTLLNLIPEWSRCHLMITIKREQDLGEEGAKRLAELEIMHPDQSPDPEIARTLSALFRAMDEDSQWDCVQRVVQLIHAHPVPRDVDVDLEWDSLRLALRREFVPRILGE